MDLKILLITMAIIVEISSMSHRKIFNDELQNFISSTKVELVQRTVRTHLPNKGVTKINLTLKNEVEANITSAEQLEGGLFRSSRENYFFNGSQVHHLRKNEDTMPESYSLLPVNDFQFEEGAVILKHHDWKNIFFLVICFIRPYCVVFTKNLVTGVTFQQRIYTKTMVHDIEVFVDRDEFFLIIVTDPCRIYGWTGNYFDLQYELDTTGAMAVATFQDKDSIVIVVAQSLQLEKVYSKVFIRRNGEIELIQLLDTSNALKVVPYTVKYGKEIYQFVLVLNNQEASSIFWWNREELALWESRPEMTGPGQIFVENIQSELFIFFISKNTSSVYHPTAGSFERVQVLVLDREILSLDLRQEPNQSPMLLFVIRSNIDPFISIRIMSMDINYIPAPASQMADSDMGLQCLLELRKSLNDRNAKLDESILLSKEIQKKSSVITLKNLTIPEVKLKNFKINHLKVSPGDKRLEATPTEIKKELEEMNQEENTLLMKMKAASKETRFRILGDVMVDHLEALHIHAKKFNDRAFDLGNILSITKNQTLSGTIRLKTLIADTITVPSINGVRVGDLLLRNKPVQEITGEYTIKSVKTGDIAFGRLGSLNGTLFSEKQRNGGNVTEKNYGKKIFSHMTVKQLWAEYINNEPADEWLSKILPNSKALASEEALKFMNLNVENLTVTNINGLPWREYFKTNICNISDNANASEVYVKRLSTRKINGIPTENFLTREGTENVSVAIYVDTLRTSCLKPKQLKLETNAGDNPNPMNISLDRIGVSKVIFNNPVNISGTLVDFDNFSGIYWMKTEPQIIESNVEFIKDLVFNDVEIERINNRPVNDLIGFDDTSSVISPLILEEAEIIGKLSIDPGAYQQFHLRNFYNSAVKTNGENYITGKKNFLGNIQVNKLNVDIINDKTTSDNDASSVDLKTMEAKRYRMIEITGNVTVRNRMTFRYLNGHPIDDLSSRASAIHSENNPRENSSTPSGMFNQWEAPKIYGIDEGNLPKYQKKNSGGLKIIIHGDLEVPSISARTVNSIPFDEYMMKVVMKNKTNQIIKGKKLFNKMVMIRNLNGTLNTYDLDLLQKNALSKSKPQNITGAFTADIFNANNVEVNIINGIPSDYLLFEDESLMQTIDSDMIFTNLAVAGHLKTLNSSCNLSKIINFDLKKVKKISKLEVKGNLTWDKPNNESKGISYLYANAVKKYHEQIITGSVTFVSNVTIERLKTKRHINDVDLKFIVDDGIYRSIPVQEIYHDVTFKAVTKANSISIRNNLIVDHINGLDILDFSQRLIRNNIDTEVRGKKQFLVGFDAIKVNAESINGAAVDQIIFCETQNETITLPPLTFHSLVTVRDFDVVNVNHVNLASLLEDRLSKSQKQVVSGVITVAGTVSVRGDVDIPQINSINLNSTVLVSGEPIPRHVTGTVEFNDSISLSSRLLVETFNNYNLKQEYERAVLNEEDSIIEGNVVFLQDLELHGNINVQNKVNGCDVKTFKLVEIPQNIGEYDMRQIREIQLKVDKVSNTSKRLIKPLVFVQLNAIAEFSLGFQTLNKILPSIHNGKTEIDIYGLDYKENCKVSSYCLLPTQSKIKIRGSNFDSISIEKVTPTFYRFYENSIGVEVTVTANTTYHWSQQNQGDGDERIKVSWRTTNRTSTNSWQYGYSVIKEKYFAGYLSDVKFFTIGDTVYIITVFYINQTENVINRLEVELYELDATNHTMTKLQDISTLGAEIVDHFWTPKGVVLVIGNGYDSELSISNMESAIYRFNYSKNKFELLRTLKTHGLLSIASARHKQDSFIFLVQKQSWPLLIFKYNREYDNYYFMQKFDIAQNSKIKSNFLYATTFKTARPGYEGDVFVAAVQSNDNFRLFQYKHIEAFVEVLQQEQKNVEIIIPFEMHSRQYLLAGSSRSNSIIYQLIEDGYTD